MLRESRTDLESENRRLRGEIENLKRASEEVGFKICQMKSILFTFHWIFQWIIFVYILWYLIMTLFLFTCARLVWLQLESRFVSKSEQLMRVLYVFYHIITLCESYY